MSDDLLPSEDRAVRLALTLARVQRLHTRRPHSANGGVPTGRTFDFVHFGQTEFPDLCDHCLTNWPCETAKALGATT